MKTFHVKCIFCLKSCVVSCVWVHLGVYHPSSVATLGGYSSLVIKATHHLPSPLLSTFLGDPHNIAFKFARIHLIEVNSIAICLETEPMWLLEKKFPGKWEGKGHYNDRYCWMVTWLASWYNTFSQWGMGIIRTVSGWKWNLK